MNIKRYIIGTLLCFLGAAIFKIIFSGFILLYSYGIMELDNVLRKGQGGDYGLAMSYLILLITCFVVTFVYKRLRKADNAILFGVLVGVILTMPEFANYFLYNIPHIKVPIFIGLQNILGFVTGMFLFRRYDHGTWWN